MSWIIWAGIHLVFAWRGPVMRAKPNQRLADQKLADQSELLLTHVVR